MHTAFVHTDHDLLPLLNKAFDRQDALARGIIRDSKPDMVIDEEMHEGSLSSNTRDMQWQYQMVRTKQTARRRQHKGNVLQPHFQPIRQQHRAMTAAKHAAISRALPQPIRDFCIPVTKAEISMDQWDARAPQRIHYGVPELVKYGAGDTDQLECLRVPAMKDRQLLGYVILPTRYRSSWVYLCYCVEYWLAVWRCWDGESKKKQKRKSTKTQQGRAELVSVSRKNAGARFLQAMVARRTVLEECIANGVNDERIKSLDEFLIRDRRDWLFLEFDELPNNANDYLQADPLHAGNKNLFEADWGVNADQIPTMLGETDNSWMAKGLDLSAMFKKNINAALKQLKEGEGVDITYDENAELPDRWHESHEPPIRFISERKEQFLRDGFTLDEPLVFLYHCLAAEDGIKRGDFLREIMDMLDTDETLHEWSSCVDQLIDGNMTWDGFSHLLAEALNLEPDRQANTIDSGTRIHHIITSAGFHIMPRFADGGEPDLPFLKLDAKIAVRAYLRNSQSDLQAAAQQFLRSIDRFPDSGTNDHQVWAWIMKTVKPDTVDAVLQEAHDRVSESLNGHHQDDIQHLSTQEGEARSSMGTDDPLSAVQTRPAEDITSDMDVMSPIQDNERHPAGHVSALIPDNIMDTPSKTPSNHTPDIITEYEDGRNIHPNSASDPISQFTAVAEEDGQSTGEDDYMPESLFSLANVQQGIRAYSYDSISFNELCSVLLTDTPAIHVQTVQATLRTLTPGHVNIKTLDALFQKLQEEAALARRVVD
ncbi:hypothetical protein BDR07DRAFT_1488420 [Suillus spraguei]|nr:hypothetical protein BDR07DRAFT_1488420 [Suillus spraguei]